MDRSGVKILLVDADQSLLKIHKLKLRLDGYQVVTGRDGKEGLEKIESEKPKLIVLDLQMPNVDGFEMLGELNKNTQLRKIPRIVLSDFDQPAIIENCLSLGVVEYLIKSQVTPEEVSSVVGRVIKKFKLN